MSDFYDLVAVGFKYYKSTLSMVRSEASYPFGNDTPTFNYNIIPHTDVLETFAKAQAY